MEVRNIRFPRTVYAIQHNITKRIYVGSSNDIESGTGYNYKDNAKPFKKTLPLKSGMPQTRES